MDYCTSDDIEIQIGKNSLVQLTNDDNTQQTVDSVVVEEALIYSFTLIDGYLRGKYNLPLNTQFPLLRVIAIDISYDEIPYALIAELTEIDGNYLVYEDIFELPIADVIQLQEAIGGKLQLKASA